MSQNSLWSMLSVFAYPIPMFGFLLSDAMHILNAFLWIIHKKWQKANIYLTSAKLAILQCYVCSFKIIRFTLLSTYISQLTLYNKNSPQSVVLWGRMGGTHCFALNVSYFLRRSWLASNANGEFPVLRKRHSNKRRQRNAKLHINRLVTTGIKWGKERILSAVTYFWTYGNISNHFSRLRNNVAFDVD